MYPSDFPTLELAFYRQGKIKYYSIPDTVFILEDGENGPPLMRLLETGSNYTNHNPQTTWFIYADDAVYIDGIPANVGFYHARILKLCVLMIGLFVVRDEELRLMAKGCCQNILNQKGFFNPYSELSLKHLDFLIDFSRRKFLDTYRVLSFCEHGNEVRQDIQKDTDGMYFEQFRYHVK